LGLFPDVVTAHLEARAAAVQPLLVAPIRDLVDGRAVLDERQRTKQPDWTHDPVDSGQWPADRLDDHRAVVDD
jgi:hypothetical protein